MSTVLIPPPYGTGDLSLLDRLVAINAAALTETLFYGIHFVLFCVCVFLFTRDRRPTLWIILGSAFIMFALSTADISITIRNPIFVTNNFIAELILLYRCYMIWGRSKYVLVAASFLVLGDTIWGYLSMSGSLLSPPSKFLPVYLWSILAINIVITMVAAGRIFWISHIIARPILGHRNLRHYHFAIAVLLESSAVYCACLLIFLFFPYPRSPYRVVTAIIVMRVVAIMPTLLIVQIGLNHIVKESGPRDSERLAVSIVLDTIVSDNQENQDGPQSEDVREVPK